LEKPFTLSRLLADVKRLTKGEGKKAALAKHLRVPRPRVSEWLAGLYEPGGAKTLALLNWVEEQEANKKSPRPAATGRERKTRRKDPVYEPHQRRADNHANKRAGCNQAKHLIVAEDPEDQQRKLWEEKGRLAEHEEADLRAQERAQQRKESDVMIRINGLCSYHTVSDRHLLERLCFAISLFDNELRAELSGRRADTWAIGADPMRERVKMYELVLVAVDQLATKRGEWNADRRSIDLESLASDCNWTLRTWLTVLCDSVLNMRPGIQRRFIQQSRIWPSFIWSEALAIAESVRFRESGQRSSPVGPDNRSEIERQADEAADRYWTEFDLWDMEQRLRYKQKDEIIGPHYRPRD